MKDYAYLPRRSRQALTEIIRATPPPRRPMATWYSPLWPAFRAAAIVFAACVAAAMAADAIEFLP